MKQPSEIFQAIVILQCTHGIKPLKQSDNHFAQENTVERFERFKITQFLFLFKGPLNIPLCWDISHDMLRWQAF
jgi:hypothetical protein